MQRDYASVSGWNNNRHVWSGGLREALADRRDILIR